MCLRRCFVLFVTLLTCLSLSFTCYAVGSGSDYEFENEDVDLEDLDLQQDPEDPIMVQVVEPDPEYEVYVFDSRATGIEISDNPPADPLFYGSGYITGTDPNLGSVTLYFPINYKSGYWGVDSSGYLYNVTSSSMSGYLDGVYNNSVSASGFSYPRYRTSSSSYDYVTLYLKPQYSNMEIATQMVPVKTSEDLLPYLSICLLGVIIVCFTKLSRS